MSKTAETCKNCRQTYTDLVDGRCPVDCDAPGRYDRDGQWVSEGERGPREGARSAEGGAR